MPQLKKITANVGKGDERESRSVEVMVPDDGDIAGWISTFGAGVCASALFAQLRLDIQQILREGIAGGKDDSECQALIDAWKWGEKRERVPMEPKQRILKDATKLTPEEKAEIIRMLQEE